MNANNFVPITRTPWGGKKIIELKKKSMPHLVHLWPERCGESWEISTDKNFPSSVVDANGNASDTFTALLEKNPIKLLGKKSVEFHSHFCPLLLKWLNAQEVLSVQLHPNNQHPSLKADECGKPESWLVLDTEPGGYVYLGFKEGLTQEQCIEALRKHEPDSCLHKVFPKKYDFISVPTGCIHAVGPGLLIAEPQYVKAGKSGKTWRISDWNRKYLSNGEQSPQGQSRELHLEHAMDALDWSLPRGAQLEKILIEQALHNQKLGGHKFNPFVLKLLTEQGDFKIPQLMPEQFFIATLASGFAKISHDNSESVELNAGESVFISANVDQISVSLNSPNPMHKPCLAFFALNEENL